MALPLLNIKGTDVFESPPEQFVDEFADLSHAASIMFLKFRLLLDLRALRWSSMLRQKVPSKILGSIGRSIVQNSGPLSDRGPLDPKDQSLQIQELKRQV